MSNLTFWEKIIFGLSPKKPNFWVIDITNKYLQATLLKADFAEKNILLYENHVKELEEASPSYLLKELENLFKKISQKSISVILNVDSDLASTVYSSVLLIRQKSNKLIDEADFDNLISRAVWKFFDRQRPFAAKRMAIEEIDALLSDVRIHGIKIDGHKVVSPLGFGAKSVEICLSGTFAARNLIKGVHKIMPLNKIAFISEAGATISRALFNAIGGTEPVILADLYSDRTAVFFASSNYSRHIDDFSWGKNSLINVLRENFKLDSAVAEIIMEIYAKNSGSPRLIRKLENLLVEECQIFANGIESLAPEQGNLFINSRIDLPPRLISDCLELKFNKNFKIRALSAESIVKNFGFRVQFNKSVKKIKNLATLVSALLELFSTPKNEKIDYLANRRTRWLLS